MFHYYYLLIILRFRFTRFPLDGWGPSPLLLLELLVAPLHSLIPAIFSLSPFTHPSTPPLGCGELSCQHLPGRLSANIEPVRQWTLVYDSLPTLDVVTKWTSVYVDGKQILVLVLSLPVHLPGCPVRLRRSPPPPSPVAITALTDIRQL